MANSSSSGRMSWPNCCTATAPWSIIRRRNASITPAMTRNEDQTSPWKMMKATADSTGKSCTGKAEDERPVHVQVARHRLEVNPAPDQREGDGRRQQAAPHDQPVREAAQPAAAKDVSVGGELQKRPPSQTDRVAGQRAAGEERLPAAAPVHAGRRTLQPHRVPVADAEGREERRERVADQRRIEVLQGARADDDRRCQRGGDERGPGTRSNTLERLARGYRKCLRPRNVARVKGTLIGDA